ncbi:MAG: hypothetical protein WCB85_14805 [Candidatus Dormiibacterota bacterium]
MKVSAPRMAAPLIAAAVVLAGCAAAHSHLTTSAAPRPSTSRPAQASTPYPGKPTPSGPLPTPPPAAMVACTLADLQVTGWSGGYLGDVTESVDFTDNSSAACNIAGAPTIRLTLSSGGLEPVALGQFATLTVDVQPRQSALLLFGSSALCVASEPPPAPATSAIITLTDGDAWIITGPMYVGCGAPSVVVFGASAGTPPTPGIATATSPAVVAGVPSSAI